MIKLIDELTQKNVKFNNRVRREGGRGEGRRNKGVNHVELGDRECGVIIKASKLVH